MSEVNIQRHRTEIGELLLGSFVGRLCLVRFEDEEARRTVDDRIRKKLGARFVEQSDEVLKKARNQLDEYLNGNRKEFDIPLLVTGTDFQRRVWKVLMRVPYGATSTYGQIAQDIGSPRAVRAVGSALGANPISIILPCHRVVGGNGGLTGYGGGLSRKKWLLRLEQADTRAQMT